MSGGSDHSIGPNLGKKKRHPQLLKLMPARAQSCTDFGDRVPLLPSSMAAAASEFLLAQICCHLLLEEFKETDANLVFQLVFSIQSCTALISLSPRKKKRHAALGLAQSPLGLVLFISLESTFWNPSPKLVPASTPFREHLHPILANVLLHGIGSTR